MATVPEDGHDNKGLEELRDPEETDIGYGLLPRHIEGLRQLVVEPIPLDIFTGEGADSTHGGDDLLGHVVGLRYSVLRLLGDVLKHTVYLHL